MKTTQTQWQWWWLSMLMAALTVAKVQAINPCVEGGPYTNDLTCLNQGTLASGYVLAPTNFTVGVGQAIIPPTAFNLSITNGLQKYIATYDCTPTLDGWKTNSPSYNFSLSFVPPIPSVLWTPGTYTYIASVIATGSPCSAISNTLGTVTINVASNIPDVLLNVDFGIQAISAKTGYAAIGDSTTDFWNAYAQTNVAFGSLTNLVTAGGSASPVGLLVTKLPTAGINGSSDPMYDDYLGTNGGTGTLTFTNLPTGTWNLYLYASDGNFTLSVGGVSYGAETCYDGSPASSPVAWQQGVQYVLFSNVTVTNGQALSITINPGINGAAIVSGLQIASANHVVPPISTTSAIVAWGNNTYGVTNIPAGLTNVLAIAAGGSHALALKSDGTVTAWGFDGLGQTNVPTGLSNVVAIAGGGYHSLALESNGTVAAWGYNIYGQTNIPAGLTNVVAIAGGGYHSLALEGNGTVAAWGYNAYGQTNIPAGLTNVIAIAGGEYHSLALKNDGTVVAWGNNAYDQTNVPAGLANVVAIAGGGYHNLVLKSDGTVVAWGDNFEGQTNTPAGLTNVIAIAGGEYQSVALKNDGTVVVWGNNSYGVTNVPAGLTNAVAIAGGDYFNLVLRNPAIISSEIPFLYRAGAPGALNVALDSDYDGVSDLQELADRTNPNDDNSVVQLQLGYWPFDNTNAWTGSAGQLPLLATNVTGVPDWDTNAALIDSTNVAVLQYRDVETNGNANLNLRTGSLRFWFKPDWSSVTAGGAGPGSSGRLIEMGSNNPFFATNSWVVGYTTGWWSLFFSPDGSQLLFGSSTNGFGGVNLAAGIAWTSNQWHQIVLTYTPTNSLLYLDGQLATSGTGSIYYPNLATRTNGFTIGSSASGTNQARGAFDELYTFNYPLNSGVIQSNYSALAPVILAQPTNQIVLAGANVTFSVTANGLNSLTYQWFFNSSPMVGATNAIFTIANVQTNNTGSYSVAIANAVKSVVSSKAVLIVAVAPTITTPPASQTAVVGNNITFVVGASGIPLNYQWSFNGSPLSDGGGISGSHASWLTLDNIQTSAVGNYSVTVTNLAGSATASANLAVNLRPVITTQPASQNAVPGQNVEFSVAATGVPPLTCQWQFDGTNLIGQTNFSLLLPDVQAANAGTYSADLSSGAGAINSTGAVLTVLLVPTVSLSAPANGQVFTVFPTNVILTATASDTNATVVSVAFYNGTNLLNTDNTAPYTFTWSNVTTGNYVLTAHATDNNGLVATSAPVNIIVDVLPAVSIATPTNNSTIATPTNLTISATASDSDATVTQVQFFAGTSLIGFSGTPFNVIWTNPPPGSWSLTAVAVDSLGGTKVSSPVLLTVDPSTNFSAQANAYVRDGSFSNQNYNASMVLNVESSGTGTNRDAYFKFNVGGLTNVSSAKLEVYASLSGAGTVLAAAYSVTNTGWQESTITWSNRPARVTALSTNTVSGTNGAWYLFDVTGYVRTNNGVVSLALHEPTNSTQLISVNSLENSSNNPVLIIITTNAPPTVSITSPTNHAVLIGGLTITATASDVTGVAQVQYFGGSNSVGVATVPPYAVTWNNPPVGTNLLTAVATGNGGLSTTSAVVNVVVDIPPVVTLTNPVSNAVFVAGSNISLGAMASDVGGTNKQVQFFQGTTSLGIDTNVPFGLTWSNVTVGSYVLTAVATDNHGFATTSAPVNIVVDVLPTVAISSPASGSTFGAPANLIINATASDNDGTSPLVEFFAGNNLLGTDSSAPYGFTWTNPPVGTYVLKVVAVDDYGLTSTAIVTNITVSTNFSAQANAYVRDGSFSNQNYNASMVLNVESSGTETNRDAYFKFNVGGLTNVSSAKLEVYASLSGAGTVLAAAYSVTNTGWQESTITWSNRPARVTALSTNTVSGTNGAWYLFDVTGYVRTNNGVVSLALHEPTNSTQLISVNSLENSSNNPVLIIITTNAPPTVSITSPTNHAVLIGGLTITATASDVTGVAQVQYFGGSNSVGVATVPPYAVTWNNPPVGTNLLTAVATGNGGLSTTSAVVNVNIVGNPPLIAQPPTNQTAIVGQNAVFSVLTTGSMPIAYQWYSNNVLLAGATNIGLTLVNVQTNSAASYSVGITNVYGSVTSVVATLTVLVPPTITIQPANTAAIVGSNAIFTVVAAGSPPLNYQWYRSDSSAIAGATNANLTISNVQSNSDYFVIVTSAAGSVTSSTANLTEVLNPAADSDYDGRNDGQEVTDGTDPFNPNSVNDVMLGYWKFNDANVWAGNAGQLPLLATNLAEVSITSTNQGLQGSANAVLIDNPNGAILTYRDVETNGNANINYRSGTVSFWFKPDWNSGTGPGVLGRLIETGSYNPAYTNGWWALLLNPDGTQLYFASSTNGAGGINLAGGMSWTSNQWHQVVLSYSPTNSSLYLDGGLVVANGSGSIYFPNATERSNGFRIGGDASGNNQAGGAFAGLQTFNYPLTATQVLYYYDPEDSYPGTGILNVIIDSPTNGAVLQ